MRKIFSAKLSTYANLSGGFQKLAFEFDVAESLAVFVSGNGKFVEVAGRCEFDGFKAGFRRGSSDYESEVVRWAGRGANRAHFFDTELNEAFWIEKGFGLLEEE